ncbi:ankyrin repeat domain-containing protein [bacterium]|jgi:hypothetical protein|nr:ankyrin repeat domain-containing protein [bacterium]MBT6130885.1 ankyrin repeat domain-containing protein [bacterium]
MKIESKLLCIIFLAASSAKAVLYGGFPNASKAKGAVHRKDKDALKKIIGAASEDEFIISALESYGSNRRLLHIAAEWDMPELVERLLKDDESGLCAKDWAGDTPLCVAKCKGSGKVVELITKKLYSMGKFEEVKVAMQQARANEFINSIRCRIQKLRGLVFNGLKDSDSNMRYKNGLRELRQFINSLDKQDLKRAVNKKYNQSLISFETGTIFHDFASFNLSKDIKGVFQLLIESGDADLGIENSDRNTALHEAAKCSSLDMAKLFVKCGANIYATNNYMRKPHQLAYEKGKTAKLLASVYRLGRSFDGLRCSLEENDTSSEIVNLFVQNRLASRKMPSDRVDLLRLFYDGKKPADSFEKLISKLNLSAKDWEFIWDKNWNEGKAVPLSQAINQSYKHFKKQVCKDHGWQYVEKKHYRLYGKHIINHALRRRVLTRSVEKLEEQGVGSDVTRIISSYFSGDLLSSRAISLRPTIKTQEE